jgi:NADPH2:quinone reductase
VRPHISHVLPLERAAEAFELIRDRQVVGKAVLRIASG